MKSESSHHEKLIVVSFFEDLEPGYRFPTGDWPPHLTLVRPFTAERPAAEVEAVLEEALADQLSIPIEFGEAAMFGPGKDVPVTTVTKTPELQKLHDHLLAALPEGGAVHDLRWQEGKFRPHVTRQRRGAMEPGESAELDQATLLDYQDGGPDPTRTVRRTWRFGDDPGTDVA